MKAISRRWDVVGVEILLPQRPLRIIIPQATAVPVAWLTGSVVYIFKITLIIIKSRKNRSAGKIEWEHIEGAGQVEMVQNVPCGLV
jgi:hypothetical protein